MPDSFMSPILELQQFGMCYGDKLVLSEITLALPATGLCCLMGPMASGKSTLLRVLAGIAQQNASVKTWGEIYFGGHALGAAGYPGLVQQNARMLAASVQENLASGMPDRSRLTLSDQRERIVEHLHQHGLAHLCQDLTVPAVSLSLCDQRMLAVARQMFARPALLCIDEPTAGLQDADAIRLLAQLKQITKLSAILLVTHHQAQARQYADLVVLLAGGRVQEVTPAEQFFSAPQSPAGQQFVGSGHCSIASPDADPSSLDESIPPPPPLSSKARQAVSAWAGPRGFVWMLRDRLAGTPQPGIVEPLERDLQALHRVGVTRLLTLLEVPLDAEGSLRSYGIEATWQPIPDMGAPSLAQAITICQWLDQCLAAEQVVAVHCRAGHGRTGTVLAAYRIWQGESALDAIESARRLEPKWIQSQTQVDFLAAFANELAARPKATYQMVALATLQTDSAKHPTQMTMESKHVNP